jgi:hypothetical protein
MISDKLFQLENSGSAITASRVSENVVDLSQAREIGEGKDIYAVFTVTTTGTNSGTVTFSIQSSAAEAMSSPTTLVSSAAYVATTLIAPTSAGTTALGTTVYKGGTQIVLRLPPIIASKGQRWMSAYFTVSGTVGAVKVQCDIVTDIQDGQKFYPSAITVL